MIDKSKIESLISLVDDQDKGVFDLVQGQIVGLGKDVLPLLNQAYDQSENELMSDRLKALIKQLTLLKAREEIYDWKNNNSRNLYEGLSIIARFQYPKLNIEKITKTINVIRQELWLEINENMTALEKVRILNHLFFDIHMFRGDTKDFYAAENFFLNDVVIRKKGSPLTLSSVYSIIAQSVNIPVYGVNMPNHFIVAYTDRLYTQPLSDIEINNVLFFINPYNRGEIYSLKEMRHFLSSMKVNPHNRYLLPSSNIIIIKRNLINLISTYKNLGEKEKVKDYTILLNELSSRS
ncbi:MAG: transglutaminase family protein [Bacteroidales bacterium]|nr:transglutaminase family protein [Bacteroidales bacterium]